MLFVKRFPLLYGSARAGPVALQSTTEILGIKQYQEEVTMTLQQSAHSWKLKGIGAALLIAMGTTLTTQPLQADTAAGTVLTNSVTVDYNDAGGTAQTQLTASVDVTVALVPVVAWGAAPTGQTTSSGGTLPATYSINLTNVGNGSDSYNITDTTIQTCTVGALSAESFAFTTPLTLGATVTAAAASFDGVDTTIPVSNLVVADFADGDTVVISDGATTFTVVGAKVSATQLAVSGDQTAAFNAAGLQVGERVSYSYGATGTAGTLSGGATTCDHEHTLTADGTQAAANGGNAETQDSVNGWVTTVNGVTLAVAKYVRNVTTASRNTGAVAVTYGGVDYYAAGVLGNPGETLEYLVVITNGSAGDSTGVEFNDTLPEFTTYTTSSIAVDTNGDETFDVTLPGSETEADGEAGIVTQTGQAIQIFAGTGGNENTDTGGSITSVSTAPNNKSAVRYQITID